MVPDLLSYRPLSLVAVQGSVGFRDDEGAARQRVEVLEGELRDLGDRRDELAARRATLDTRVAEQVGSRAGRVRQLGWIVVSVLVGLGIGVLVDTAIAGLVPGDRYADVLYGSVREVEGDAPVLNGALCTVLTTPLDHRRDEEQAQFHVECGGRLVYGGDLSGRAYCDEQSGYRNRCRDEAPTSEDGDPRMHFDRELGELEVADDGWRIVLDLASGAGHD